MNESAAKRKRGIEDAYANQACTIKRLTSELEEVKNLCEELRKAMIKNGNEAEACRNALEMYETHMSVMQKDAENYLIPDNNCNKDWFVSRMLDHLDGPMQREVQKAAREALEES